MPRGLLCLIVEGQSDQFFFEHWVWPKIKKYYPCCKKPIIAIDNENTMKAQKLRIPITDQPEHLVSVSTEKIDEMIALRERSEIWKLFKDDDPSDNTKKVVLKDNDSATKKIDEKRVEIRRIYPFLKDKNIAIAVTELESWVVAGFDGTSRFAGPFININPETLKKEDVRTRLEELGFRYELEEEKYFILSFMREHLLECKEEYNFDYAIERAPSLRIFIEMLAED